MPRFILFALPLVLLLAAPAQAQSEKRSFLDRIELAQSDLFPGAEEAKREEAPAEDGEEELFPGEKDARSFSEHSAFIREHCKKNRKDPVCIDVKSARRDKQRTFEEQCKDDPTAKKCWAYKKRLMSDLLKVERICDGGGSKYRCRRLRKTVSERRTYSF